MSFTAPLLAQPSLPQPSLSVSSAEKSRQVVSIGSHLDPRYGGIAAMLPRLREAIASDGLTTAELLTTGDEAERLSLSAGDEAGARFLPAARGNWMLDGAWRKRLAQEIVPSDLVHIHGLWEPHCAAAGHAARLARKPYVISAHGMLEPWALRNKRLKKAVYAWLLERRNLSRAACLHALTLAEAQDYRRFGLTNPIAVIPNGVSVPTLISPDAFFERFPALRDRRIVLFLGRLHPKKGLDLLVRAWGGMQAEKSPALRDAHLVIAGPDSEGTQDTVARLTGELGIINQVTFTGMLAGNLKWSALAASTYSILPSHSEGLSMSVLESLGVGRPVIITRQCNLPEVLRARCGWVIEPAVEQLTSTLVDALTLSPGPRSAMGDRGRALVRSQFSWDFVGTQMRAVYEWILGGEKPAGVPLL